MWFKREKKNKLLLLRKEDRPEPKRLGRELSESERKKIIAKRDGQYKDEDDKIISLGRYEILRTEEFKS